MIVDSKNGMKLMSIVWHIPEGFATLVAGLFVMVAAAIAWWSVQR
jgi:hypothetical protein